MQDCLAVLALGPMSDGVGRPNILASGLGRNRRVHLRLRLGGAARVRGMCLVSGVEFPPPLSPSKLPLCTCECNCHVRVTPPPKESCGTGADWAGFGGDRYAGLGRSSRHHGRIQLHAGTAARARQQFFDVQVQSHLKLDLQTQKRFPLPQPEGCGHVGRVSQGLPRARRIAVDPRRDKNGVY